MIRRFCLSLRDISAILPALLAVCAAPACAQTLTISAAATGNVVCASGVCTATAADAVLSVTTLRRLLAASNVKVAAGAAEDIRLASGLTWASANTLALAANRSIAIDAPLSVAGTGGLALSTGSSGTLSFGRNGDATFWSDASALVIDGANYTLVSDIATLASDIAAHPRRNYALGGDIALASAFSATPIPTTFHGTFEGLGHRISNFELATSTDSDVGLFGVLGGEGVIRDIGLVNANVNSENAFFALVGALVGQSYGTIAQSYATGLVMSDFQVDAGGLAGVSEGRIENAYANVNVSGADGSELGGLAGNAHGHVLDCYAEGPIAGGDNAFVGGLIGYNLAEVHSSYATGTVSGGQASETGGFAGTNNGGSIARAYWDTTTSGTTKGVDNGNEAGVTGLTTAQLRAGLPMGFNAAVWNERPAVNGGLPYLLLVPPS